MKKSKILIAAAGFLALAATVMYQQARMGRLTAETAMLREQLQRAASAQNQPERHITRQPGDELRSNSAPSLTRQQLSELLRLRGAVGVLRGQLAEAVAREASQRTQSQVTAEPPPEPRARPRVVDFGALEVSGSGTDHFDFDLGSNQVCIVKSFLIKQPTGEPIVVSSAEIAFRDSRGDHMLIGYDSQTNSPGQAVEFNNGVYSIRLKPRVKP